MKKTIALLLTIIFAVALLPVTAGAAAFNNGTMTLALEGADTLVEGTHYTYEPEAGGSGYLLALLQSGSYTLSGAASDRLRVVASATNITLTLDGATFTGPDDAVNLSGRLSVAAIEFPYDGALVACGISAVTGGGGSRASIAVCAWGDLAVEVPDGAALTLTGGTNASGSSAAALQTMIPFDLTLTVGAGTLRCETGNAQSGDKGGGITAGGAIRLAFTSAAGRVEAVGYDGSKGIRADSLSVTGAAGTLAARGGDGIFILGDTLDLGAARVTAEGTEGAGVWFDAGATLAGSGTLTATGTPWLGIACPGISVMGDLTLAYTGDLSAKGADGPSQMFPEGLVAGDALLVQGNLTVEATPRSLALTGGLWNEKGYDANGDLDDTVKPGGFYAVRVVSGSLSPLGSVPITEATVSHLREILWTRSTSDDSEWVSVYPAGTDKQNPHTGQ